MKKVAVVDSIEISQVGGKPVISKYKGRIKKLVEVNPYIVSHLIQCRAYATLLQEFGIDWIGG